MLIAFNSAAKLGSFTEAAKELNLTQSAISRQISALEDQLSISLFQRGCKTITLTEIGKQYAQEIDSALKMIQNASLDAMSNPLNGNLNLAILPTFGTRWLIPKLPSFFKENPNINVHFISKISPFDFNNENIHAAIHYGSANWCDTHSTFLMKEESFPVCSPKYLEMNSIKTPQDLSQMPLLHLVSRNDQWKNWFKVNDINSDSQQGMCFEQFSFITKAAVVGLGIALLPKFLIKNELERGELTVIFDKPFSDNTGYYLVTPISKTDFAPNVAFRNWLLKNISE